MSTEPISDRFRAGRPIRSAVVNEQEERSTSVVRYSPSARREKRLYPVSDCHTSLNAERSTRHQVQRTRPLGRENEDLRSEERRCMDYL